MNSYSIVDSVDKDLLERGLSTVKERYYNHQYCMDLSGISNMHQRVSFHLNRICLLSLAENHPIIKEQKRINRVIRVRHSQKLRPDTIVCYFNCVDGGSYPLYSCVKGKLLEINNQLEERPNLLSEDAFAYVALILPEKKKSPQTFLTQKQYFDYVNTV